MEEPLSVVIDRIGNGIDVFMNRMKVKEFSFSEAQYQTDFTAIRESLDYVRQYDADKTSPDSALVLLGKQEQLRKHLEQLKMRIGKIASQLMIDGGENAIGRLENSAGKYTEADILRDQVLDETKDEFTALLQPIATDMKLVFSYINAQLPEPGKAAGGMASP